MKTCCVLVMLAAAVCAAPVANFGFGGKLRSSNSCFVHDCNFYSIQVTTPVR
jgi:hypothetical protein